VRDVVRANVAAVEGRVAEQITNVATGVATTTIDVARGLAKALGVTPEIQHGPQRPGDLERSVLEPARWMGEPVALLDGLRETADWFAARKATSGG
jgi:UDP-glucose 4-epimerase